MKRFKHKKKPPLPRKGKITMDCVSSSNLDKLAYDFDSKELAVRFKSGATYAYAGVSHEHWDGLSTAASKGSYLAKEIKPVYASRKLEDV